jgi:hypothetical protein
MSPLQELQKWYRSQCNGNWEHAWGIKIGTLDNPGWSLLINLADTDLANKAFAVYSSGLPEQSELDRITAGEIAHSLPNGTKRDADDWIHCKVEDQSFKAFGGPFKLEEMIKVFLRWKDQASR